MTQKRFQLSRYLLDFCSEFTLEDYLQHFLFHNFLCGSQATSRQSWEVVGNPVIYCLLWSPELYLHVHYTILEYDTECTSSKFTEGLSFVLVRGASAFTVNNFLPVGDRRLVQIVQYAEYCLLCISYRPSSLFIACYHGTCTIVLCALPLLYSTAAV